VNGTDAAATAITVSCPVWLVYAGQSNRDINTASGINFLIFLG
jgi:hypothetical protein